MKIGYFRNRLDVKEVLFHQLAARMQAAEKAIATMADLLTQLAASGALPKEIAGIAGGLRSNVEAIKAEAERKGFIDKGAGPAADAISLTVSTMKEVSITVLEVYRLTETVQT